ncbi:MAG: type II toxin-antitoxin system RelE/ParE family toxin [Syntrophobacteraceae bacterium]
MIKSFKDKEAEKIFSGQFSSKLPENIQRIALRKLTQLHGAATMGFLRISPANRLEKLGCDREGQWSIRINDQWRICFEWRDGDVENIEITDYH